MCVKKKNLIIVLLSFIIVFLVVFIVLVLTDTVSFKSNEVNDNKNVTDTAGVNDSLLTDDYLEFIVDNENKIDVCHNINGKNYYSYEKSYRILINNINIKGINYIFKYEKDLVTKNVKVYLNDNVSFEGIVKGVLVDVCNYGNYIVYSIGWEGSPDYIIIDTNGKEVMRFKGKKVEYSNGILNVEELKYSDNNEDQLLKYQLNMNNDNLTKDNLIIEKYVCDPDDVYDC